MSSNPLLDRNNLPRFDEIQTEHIEPAISEIIKDNLKAVATLCGNHTGGDSLNWEELIGVLEKLEERLNNAWSTVNHLHAVCNNPEIRAVFEKCQPMITEYYTDIAQSQDLFHAIDRLDKAADRFELNASQRKVVKNYLLEFNLSGVNLMPEGKKNFVALQKKLSQLAIKFSNNVLDSTKAWSKHILDKKQLNGLSEIALAEATTAAQNKQLKGYLITLDFPSYFAVITYADNESLRKEIYTAYVTRASAIGASNTDKIIKHQDNDNTEVIEKILSHRYELSSLLGYENYAGVSLAKKMAGSPGKVIEFLTELINIGFPIAQKEFSELLCFVREKYLVEELSAWDISYYSEKLRKEKFDISQDELRVYFPIENVRQGLFSIVGSLYGIEIKKNINSSVWHKDVEFYDIRRKGVVIAQFYLDVFTRENKRAGAWMADCRSKINLANNQLQIPVAYLVCNFSPASEMKPALLSHSDVTTLFHEFGHGLHHMLTEEKYLAVSGINGVAWDAVELPSQLMENWCWDSEAIKKISGHYETGETLPGALLEKLLKARNYQAGMKMMRQLEFALFDFQLHMKTGDDRSTVEQTMSEVRKKTAVFPTPVFNHFQNCFSHIFAGGYAAGYYSYKWAEVLSADVFSRFFHEGIFNPEVGEEFLRKILSRGGSANASELFANFMGREPSINALLIQEGFRKESK